MYRGQPTESARNATGWKKTTGRLKEKGFTECTQRVTLISKHKNIHHGTGVLDSILRFCHTLRYQLACYLQFYIPPNMNTQWYLQAGTQFCLCGESKCPLVFHMILQNKTKLVYLLIQKHGSIIPVGIFETSIILHCQNIIVEYAAQSHIIYCLNLPQFVQK